MSSITETQRLKIEKDSHELLIKFGESLSKLKIPSQVVKSQESSGFRQEGKGIPLDSEFRQEMFSNAPNTSGDFIIAEKKKW